MNSLSSQPFSKMCQSMPQITAMSVPERKRTYSVAWAAVRVKRGSMTITFARFSSLPVSTCCSETGCASAAFEPMKMMVLELRMSL
jgi:type IV secretory pathway TrbF-like protein